MLKIFEIALPVKMPDGRPCEGKHFAFQSLALQEAGGYTIRPDGDGAWYNPGDGVTYYDTMRPYRIATDEGIMARLIEAAFRLWPDEKALFVTEVGTAHVMVRPEPAIEGRLA